jgi:hypothetical protein
MGRIHTHTPRTCLLADEPSRDPSALRVWHPTTSLYYTVTSWLPNRDTREDKRRLLSCIDRPETISFIAEIRVSAYKQTGMPFPLPDARIPGIGVGR